MIRMNRQVLYNFSCYHEDEIYRSSPLLGLTDQLLDALPLPWRTKIRINKFTQPQIGQWNSVIYNWWHHCIDYCNLRITLTLLRQITNMVFPSFSCPWNSSQDHLDAKVRLQLSLEPLWASNTEINMHRDSTVYKSKCIYVFIYTKEIHYITD